MKVVGVDGCRGGWVAVVLDRGRFDGFAVCPTFAAVLERLPDAEVFGVDVPIGLPGRPGRKADRAAAALLGGRASTVFETFPRMVYRGPTYEAARDLCVERGWRKISRQSYGLGPRILEVGRRRRDPRIIEVHPELSFLQMARHALASKHTWDGFFQRRRLLAAQGVDIPERLDRAPLVDVLDAAAAAWSAARYGVRKASPVPEGHAGRMGAIWR